MKKLLFFVVIVATFCFVSCNPYASEESKKPEVRKVQIIDGLWVFEKEEGDVSFSVKKYKGIWGDSESITIPSTCNGEPVTSIGEKAFYEHSELKNITIPSNITSIGDSAFYGCSILTSITIPEGVTSIGDFAFYGCKGLTKIVISSSVTSIGKSAFPASSLESIEVEVGNSTYYSDGNCLIKRDSKILVLGCKK